MSTRRMGNRRGQSTLEYVLVLGAVLLAIIAIVSTAIKPGVDNVMNKSGKTIEKSADQIEGGLGLP